MTDHPLVSVCIPCYRYPYLVERCLDSVLEQTYPNFEVVITDDSDDDTIEKLIKSKYAIYDINYNRNVERQGSPKNWNMAVSLAKGNYIKIMHHDDWFADKDALYLLMNTIVNQKADFVFCNCVNVYPNFTRFHKVPNLFINLLKKNVYLILYSNLIGDPSVTLFRKKEVIFDAQLKWFVDSMFYVEYLLCYPKSAYVDAFLVNVTAGHSTQITNSEINNSLILSETAYIRKKLKFTGINVLLFKLFESIFRLKKLIALRSIGFYCAL